MGVAITILEIGYLSPTYPKSHKCTLVPDVKGVKKEEANSAQPWFIPKRLCTSTIS